MKLLYKLESRGLSQLSDGTFCTHSLPGGFGKYFDNFNAAFKDLEETYCYNIMTGKKLSKREILKIKSRQNIERIRI